MSAPQSISEIDWSSVTSKQFHSSPERWVDQVMYFLLIDRFANGQIDIPECTPELIDSAVHDEFAAQTWRNAGYTYCGGTIQGVTSKLAYLKRLGITTIWLSPVLQQTAFDTTSYHGYGAQNFLAVDPRFGTESDLQALVAAAHQLDIYIVLDIVVNHAGHVFDYDVPVNSETEPTFKRDGTYPVRGYLDHKGDATIPFGAVDISSHPQAWPSGAVWPKELQSPESFNRRGCIDDWEEPDQYLHGDFKFLKDFNLGETEAGVFEPSDVLKTMVKIYQYWLAFADLDGYRLDAVKHMGIDAARYFVAEIQAFARKLGKENFALFGEIPGGQQTAQDTLEQTGLTAALALLDIPSDLEAMIKGERSPSSYFQHFAGQELSGYPITWNAEDIVLFLDDHDQIRKNFDKARFAAGSKENQALLLPALATLVCSAGIPCIYYGSEQAFDGAGSHDRYIRECMFGAGFGPFRSAGHHCFNEHNPVYQQLQRLLHIRKESEALRRGHQQLLKISGDGEHFGYPEKLGDRMSTLIPWLRWTEAETVLCVVNTDPHQSQTMWVEFPSALSRREHGCRCQYDSAQAGLGKILPFTRNGESKRIQVKLDQASFALFSC